MGQHRANVTAAQCAAFLKHAKAYARSDDHVVSNCPNEERWFETFRKVDPSSGKVFINIGCNKGTDSGAFLHRWDESFSFFDFADAYRKAFPRQPGGCGEMAKKGLYAVKKASDDDKGRPSCPSKSPPWGCTCQDFSDWFGASPNTSTGRAQLTEDILFWNNSKCSTWPWYFQSRTRKAKVPESLDGKRSVTHCVEAMSSTVEALKTLVNLLPSEQQIGFQIHHFAVGTGVPDTVQVPIVGAGTEGYGIVLNAADMEAVPHISLDKFMEDKPGLVDFLQIDTEGHDPVVLFGGSQTLLRTRYVAFENHAKGYWMKMDLRMVVNYLDALGFECFWTGNDGSLWQITGCYPFIDIKHWSNVGCARRGDVFLTALRRLAKQNGGLPDEKV